MSNYILYGGSFNPLHRGHVNIVDELLEKYEDHELIIMPAFQSPLKEYDYDPGAEARFMKLKNEFENNQKVIVEDIELVKAKQCFTVDLLPELIEKHTAKSLKLVIGLDQLLQFHKWKNYQEIIKYVDLVVVSRPGFNFLEVEELPSELVNEFETYTDTNFVFKTGKTLSYFELKDNYDISSTQIRSHLRKGKDMSGHLTDATQDFIKENKLYLPLKSKVNSYEDFTKDCFQILKEKNALGVLAYDVRNITQPSDFNLIASGTNIRQTSSLAENLIRTVKKKYALSPVAVEGIGEGRWVVIDYGSLIVHIFYDFIRSEYNLEELWTEGLLLESDE